LSKYELALSYAESKVVLYFTELFGLCQDGDFISSLNMTEQDREVNKHVLGPNY